MTFDEACARYDLLSIDGWMDAVGELPWLYEQAQRTEGLIVEIGTYKGRSAATIIAGLLDAGRSSLNLICVDAFDGRCINEASQAEVAKLGPGGLLYEFVTNLLVRGLPLPTVIVSPSRSSVVRSLVRADCIDWVFIDGDHSETGILCDLAQWTEALKYPALLSGHDYGDDVKRVVDEQYGDRVEHPAGSIWAVRA